MPLINFDESLYWATDIPEKADEVAFDIYENYLESTINLIKIRYRTKFITAMVTYTKDIKPNTSLSIDYIKRFLFLGWNTECLVKINDAIPDVDLLRVNNQWKPIQVYYSIYSLCEAAYYSLTTQKLESHSKCLKAMSEYLSKKPFQPWSYTFTGYLGNTKKPRTIKPNNFSDGIVIPNSLKRKDISDEEVLACCLQAEHRNRIEDYKRSKKGTLKYMYDPGNTSLLHFLYRLRIKSTYKNVGIFLARAPDRKISSFSKNLTSVCTYTNVLFEILIARRIGKKQMLEVMQEFAKKHKNTKPIADRLENYRILL
jgi:hypothetical protein